jgi:hypothetical protein
MMISLKVKLIFVMSMMAFLCCSALGNEMKKEMEAREANIHSDRVMSKLVNSFKTMAQIDALNTAPQDELVVQILMNAILQRIAQMIQEQQMVPIEHLRQ